MSRDQIEFIRSSGLFDKKFYKLSNPDLKNVEDVIEHYVNYGCEENRDPTVFFSTKGYKKEYGNILNGENPFVHYIKNNNGKVIMDKGCMEDYSFDAINLVISRLKKLPYYSDKEYIRMNADKIILRDPAEHAITIGMGEGREFISKINVAKFLGKESKKNNSYNIISGSIEKCDKTFGVFYHTKGNVFIKELSEILVEYLIESGLNTTLYTEELSIDNAPDVCIFSAPHEFFFLKGSEDWNDETIIRKSIMFNTEQPQTLWFCRALMFILMSDTVIDLSYQNMKAFEEVGLKTFFFDPIPKIDCGEILTSSDKNQTIYKVIPETSSSPFDASCSRHYDVSFFGNSSPKRDKFFAKSSQFFSELETFIYYRKSNGVIPSNEKYDVLSRLPKYVTQRSKIALNIHRDDSTFFEWHRIVLQAMTQGAVVVTDECLPHPLYIEGVHYMVETPRHMPDLIDWLLNTVEGNIKLSTIQHNCFNILRREDIKKSKQLDANIFFRS